MVSQKIVDFVNLDRSANSAREQFFDVYFFNHFEPLITTKLHWCQVACMCPDTLLTELKASMLFTVLEF